MDPIYRRPAPSGAQSLTAATAPRERLTPFLTTHFELCLLKQPTKSRDSFTCVSSLTELICFKFLHFSGEVSRRFVDTAPKFISPPPTLNIQVVFPSTTTTKYLQGICTTDMSTSGGYDVIVVVVAMVILLLWLIGRSKKLSLMPPCKTSKKTNS